MEEKPIGGAPPAETTKPKPSNELKPVFDVEDLELINVHTENAITYLTFGVNGEFNIIITQFEYFSLLSALYMKLESLMELNADCMCNLCSPEFEFLDDDCKVTHIEIKEDKTQKETEKNIPTYACWALAERLQVGDICKVKEK